MLSLGARRGERQGDRIAPLYSAAARAQDGVMRVVWLWALWLAAGIEPADLPVSKRAADALSGTEFAKKIAELPLEEREREIARQVESGNVPEFWRKFVTVTIREGERVLEMKVAPDYLAVGSDEDFFLAPLRPGAAQAIADKLGCVLPTPKMVDAIYAAAEVKLEPRPIPPSERMTTVPVFADHNAIVREQRTNSAARLGALIAGHKKDVVICAKLASAPGKVAIYGWHRLDGRPIQPVYLGHGDRWVDYSHGIRFVLNEARLDGKPVKVTELLRDENLASLVSGEGVLGEVKYPAQR